MTEPTALETETVISERDGKKWKHTLVDTKPNDKQTKELDSRNGIENDDELYPEEKIKVGHKWETDAGALVKLLGNTFSDVKGKVNQTFTKIEDLDGEKVAVIESTTKFTAKMKDDGEPTIDVEMELKVTTWRSLKTGVDWENVHGAVASWGLYKGDHLGAVRGNILFDRALVAKQPVETVTASLRVDPRQPDVLSIPAIRGKLYGGDVGGEAWVMLDSPARYALQLNAARVRLSEIANQYKRKFYHLMKMQSVMRSIMKQNAAARFSLYITAYMVWLK